MLNGSPSDDDHAERVAQRTRGDAEAIQGDVITILHIAFLKFVAADVGAVPIDFCNLLTPSIQVNFEGALSAAGGRVFSTQGGPTRAAFRFRFWSL